MESTDRRTPPGPSEKYNTTEDLLGWMETNVDRFGDVYKASVFGRDVYVVSSPELADHVLVRNWRNYLRKGHAVKRISMLLGNGLISSNGEFWVNQRRMMQPAFSRKAALMQADVMISANSALLEKWKSAAVSRTAVNVTQDISRMVLKITLVSLFGEDYDEIAPHFNLVSERSRDLEFAQMFTALGHVIVDLAARRRNAQSQANDTLGMLIQARERTGGEPMQPLQLAREVMTLIVAGHETTASVLNWTWYLLAEHPLVEAKLTTDLKPLLRGQAPSTATLDNFTYTRKVIDEVLRLYPPLWLMTRRAQDDDRLGDYFVPAGTEIYISPYLIHRREAFWRLPDDFDPDRFDADDSDESGRALCPFGSGPRKCIGEFFARVEIQIHLMMIAKELRLRGSPSNVAEMAAGMNLLSKHDFFMTPELKHPVD